MSSRKQDAHKQAGLVFFICSGNQTLFEMIVIIGDKTQPAVMDMKVSLFSFRQTSSITLLRRPFWFSRANLRCISATAPLWPSSKTGCFRIGTNWFSFGGLSALKQAPLKKNQHIAGVSLMSLLSCAHTHTRTTIVSLVIWKKVQYSLHLGVQQLLGEISGSSRHFVNYRRIKLGLFFFP